MKRALLLAGFAPLFLHISPASAASVQVGSPACKPNLFQYNTITEALAASPPKSTIYICPGIYAEQLTITKSVNLIGSSDTASSAPTIVPPSTGLVANYQPPTPTGQQQPPTPYAAQVAFIGAVNGKITNMTVDGSSNQIAGCGPILIGILFERTAGTIAGNQVVNQSLTPQDSLGGCQSGNAIIAESDDTGSYMVSITGNQVSNFQKNGITADGVGLSYTITGNTVVGEGATSYIAQNGIQAGPSAISGATVTGNIVSDEVYTGSTYGATGILVYDSPSVTVGMNTVSNTQGGVYVYQDTSATDSPTVSKNIVTTTHTYDGVDVCGVTGGSITANTINGSDESAVHVDGECPNPSMSVSVMGNKVNGACVGVLEGPSTTLKALSGNTLLNTITQVQTSSDFCTVTTPQIAARMGGHTRSARRPSPRL